MAVVPYSDSNAGGKDDSSFSGSLTTGGSDARREGARLVPLTLTLAPWKQFGSCQKGLGADMFLTYITV